MEATIFSTFIMFHSHDNLVCRQCYFHFAGGENEVQYVGLRATEHTKIVFRDFFFHLLRAAPRAYRASQARGQISTTERKLGFCVAGPLDMLVCIRIYTMLFQTVELSDLVNTQHTISLWPEGSERKHYKDNKHGSSHVSWPAMSSSTKMPPCSHL